MTNSTIDATDATPGEGKDTEESTAGSTPQAKPAPPQDLHKDSSDELAEWKRHARKHEDRAKDLASQVQDLTKQLDEAKGLAARVAELEGQLAATENAADRVKAAAEVAQQKGVKLRYITGETREEMEASADEWLADAKSVGRTGVVPTQGTGDSAPRVSSFESGAERARAQHVKKHN